MTEEDVVGSRFSFAQRATVARLKSPITMGDFDYWYSWIPIHGYSGSNTSRKQYFEDILYRKFESKGNSHINPNNN